MMFNIIPAIDILDAKVVRLTQGVYEDKIVYSDDPIELAKRFESFGAKRLHIVDLNGAKDGYLVHEDLIKAIRKETGLCIEVGGGIRDEKTISSLLNWGIDYVILGSIFIKDFEAAKQICAQFKGKVIAGIDAKEGMVATHGWLKNSNLSAIELIKKVNPLPLAEIIFTDIAKDGMMLGPNMEALQKVATFSKHPVIASGGVSSKKDIDILKPLYTSNISGCIVGKALLSQKIELKDLWLN